MEGRPKRPRVPEDSGLPENPPPFGTQVFDFTTPESTMPTIELPEGELAQKEAHQSVQPKPEEQKKKPDKKKSTPQDIRLPF